MSSRGEIQSLRRELEKLYMDKELYLRQRSKTQWAKEGDKNTKYFHMKATSRKCAN